MKEKSNKVTIREFKEATYITPSPGHQSAALDNIAKVLKDLDSNICSALTDRNRNLTELLEQKDVRVTSYKRHTSFLWKVDKSAQLYKSFADGKSIPNMSVRLVHKINVDCNGINGSAMSEAGNMLFLQAYHNNLLKYGPDGQFDSKSSMNPDRDCSHIGFDIADVDSHTAVVSAVDVTRHIFTLLIWIIEIS
ncbi:unnamed protein product [Mytilus edulis]|uniref:Uncharacterized protein n=1 Tax=Mytilus edulis TaxID=6550 RepID=A0A8S3PSR3_MYTED|nr:unnamed protein product [Mytilus edulis]